VIGQFKQKSPVNSILLLILGLLIKAPLFLYNKPVPVSETDGKLYSQLIVPLFQIENGPLTTAVIAFALLYIQALLLNYLVNEYRLLPRHTYLPAMAYLLITSLLPEWNYFSAPLLANTFIIWAFIQLFKLYNTQRGREIIYNLGLITGISAFIFFPSVLITICLLIGIMTLRPFRLNELFLLLLGVLTPFYFYAVYLFLNDSLTVQNVFSDIHLQIPVIQNSIWLSVSVALLAIPFLIGGYFVQTNLHKMLIQSRKNWSILLLYLLLAIFIPFVNTAPSFANWILLTVPFAAFHSSAYFYLTRKWVYMSLFLITLGVIIYQQYGTAIWR